MAYTVISLNLDPDVTFSEKSFVATISKNATIPPILLLPCLGFFSPL